MVGQTLGTGIGVQEGNKSLVIVGREQFCGPDCSVFFCILRDFEHEVQMENVNFIRFPDAIVVSL